MIQRNDKEESVRITSKGGHEVQTTWTRLVWWKFRPYLIRFSEDLLIFMSLWVVLFFAHWLTTALPLSSLAAKFLVGVHETVVVLSFLWLSLTALFDLVQLKLRR